MSYIKAILISIVVLLLAGIFYFGLIQKNYFNIKEPVDTDTFDTVSDINVDANKLFEEGKFKVMYKGSDYIVSKEGERVGDLIISKLEPIETFGVSITFIGPIQVKGSYIKHRNDGEEMPNLLKGNICLMQIDSESSRNLPKLAIDERNPWFCFSNGVRAEELFSKMRDSGEVTVLLDSYNILYAPTEVYNTATIKEVVLEN